jgi:branched-chain amino acid transport system permease protein
MNLDLVIQNLLIGIVDGGFYVLVALGLTLLFGVSRVINLAHGEFLAVGGYVTFLAVAVLGIGPIGGLIAAVAFGYGAGWLTDRALLAPMRRRPNLRLPLELYLIMTLGISLSLENGLLAAFGDNYVTNPPVVQGVTRVFGQVSLANQRILVFAVCMILVLLMFVFLNRTRMGTAIRAASQDRNAARAVGIEVETLDSRVFGIATALAAAAGSLMAPLIFLYPAVGLQWMIKGIVVVIMGGLGNPVGALVAGFGLGIVEALAVIVLPAQYKTVVGLLVMIGVLLVRPSGLLGRRLLLE